MSAAQKYLDDVAKQLGINSNAAMDFGAPVAPAAPPSGPVAGVMAFVKKYWIHILVAVVLIILIAVFASGKSVSSFASLSGNEEEDTATWEQIQYQLPPSPYEPTEPIKV